MESVRFGATSLSWQILRTETRSDVDTFQIRKKGAGY